MSELSILIVTTSDHFSIRKFDSSSVDMIYFTMDLAYAR